MAAIKESYDPTGAIISKSDILYFILLSLKRIQNYENKMTTAKIKYLLPTLLQLIMFYLYLLVSVNRNICLTKIKPHTPDTVYNISNFEVLKKI